MSRLLRCCHVSFIWRTHEFEPGLHTTGIRLSFRILFIEPPDSTGLTSTMMVEPLLVSWPSALKAVAISSIHFCLVLDEAIVTKTELDGTSAGSVKPLSDVLPSSDVPLLRFETNAETPIMAAAINIIIKNRMRVLFIICLGVCSLVIPSGARN